MSKFDKCAFSSYFAEYSISYCEHPDNPDKDGYANCRGCKLFMSRKQKRIEDVKQRIRDLERELDKLNKKSKREVAKDAD